MGQTDNLVLALADDRLVVLNHNLSLRHQSLRIDQICSQIFDLADYRLVLLVHGGFLPTREHNDEIELANALLGRALGLHLAEGLE